MRHEAIPDYHAGSLGKLDTTVAGYHAAQLAAYDAWLKGMEETGDESPSSDPVLIQPEYNENGHPPSWVLRLRTRYLNVVLPTNDRLQVEVAGVLIREAKDLARAARRLCGYLLADAHENQSSGQKYRWRSYAAVIRTLVGYLFPDDSASLGDPLIHDIRGTLLHFDHAGT